MPVDMEKIVSKVMSEATPSLLVDVSTTDGCATTSSYGGGLCGAASSMLSVLVFPSDALGIGFPVLGGYHS